MEGSEKSEFNPSDIHPDEGQPHPAKDIEPHEEDSEYAESEPPLETDQLIPVSEKEIIVLDDGPPNYFLITLHVLMVCIAIGACVFGAVWDLKYTKPGADADPKKLMKYASADCGLAFLAGLPMAAAAFAGILNRKSKHHTGFVVTILVYSICGGLMLGFGIGMVITTDASKGSILPGSKNVTDYGLNIISDSSALNTKHLKDHEFLLYDSELKEDLSDLFLGPYSQYCSNPPTYKAFALAYGRDACPYPYDMTVLPTATGNLKCEMAATWCLLHVGPLMMHHQWKGGVIWAGIGGFVLLLANMLGWVAFMHIDDGIKADDEEVVGIGYQKSRSSKISNYTNPSITTEKGGIVGGAYSDPHAAAVWTEGSNMSNPRVAKKKLQAAAYLVGKAAVVSKKKAGESKGAAVSSKDVTNANKQPEPSIPIVGGSQSTPSKVSPKKEPGPDNTIKEDDTVEVVEEESSAPIHIDETIPE